MNSTNFLEKLLDGEEFQAKTLRELGEFIRGSGIQKSDFTESGVGCIHYGQIHTHYGTWATKTKSCISNEFAARLRKAQKGDLVIATTSEDDNAVAKAVAWLGDEAVAVSTDAYIYRHIANPKYMSYFFQTEYFQSQKKPHITGTKVRRISGKCLEKIQIPIPCPDNPKKSLEIQAEIVRILDAFTELTTELTAELTAELTTRKRQYNYYRDRLLSFEEGQVEWKKLGDIVEIKRGRRLIKSQLEVVGDFAVYQNSMTPLGYYHESNVKADATFIISAGSAGEIGYSHENFWAADDVYFFATPGNLVNKFLYYFLLTRQREILSQVRRSSVPRLSKASFEKMPIPIPVLSEQARIVAILDKFEALTSSLTEGLPREIELRKKQYEYYRDLLLGFPVPEV